MALESLKLLEAKINGFLIRHEQVRNEKGGPTGASQRTGARVRRFTGTTAAI